MPARQVITITTRSPKSGGSSKPSGSKSTSHQQRRCPTCGKFMGKNGK